MSSAIITGRYVDLFARRIYPAAITIVDGKIAAVTETLSAPEQYIMPGFVDAHIHIESSMLVPTAFAQAAVVHGTVATVSDPHEIANVCGRAGVRFMIENSRHTPFRFFFGAPSCVPATSFETAGAVLDADAVEDLLRDPDIWYLSEMMNYPGVLHGDPQVMAKIAAAKRSGKPIDGHAPGMRGADVLRYAGAGITTDHECFTPGEAEEKISAGMHILIREGSAARNFEALAGLIGRYPHRLMFCSDDKHPDELVIGHINSLVKRAIAMGYDLFDVLRIASVNPVQHYRLPVGLLRPGDPADFIVTDNLTDFNILRTCIGGQLVAENGRTLLPQVPVTPINNFSARPQSAAAFRVPASHPQPRIRIIEAIEGQLVTGCIVDDATVAGGCIVSDPSRDILKIVVVNRYDAAATPAVAFIRNFGITSGAIASTVGHDCHNIIAVGADDESLSAAVNGLIAAKGGIAVALNASGVHVMPLPVAGLMTTKNATDTGHDYTRLDTLAKSLGTTLRAPFMTLSFMALLVIPSLKLSDLGLFDCDKFGFVPLEVS